MAWDKALAAVWLDERLRLVWLGYADAVAPDPGTAVEKKPPKFAFPYVARTLGMRLRFPQGQCSAKTRPRLQSRGLRNALIRLRQCW
jgi:hypothetical protein